MWRNELLSVPALTYVHMFYYMLIGNRKITVFALLIIFFLFFCYKNSTLIIFSISAFQQSGHKRIPNTACVLCCILQTFMYGIHFY